MRPETFVPSGQNPNLGTWARSPRPARLSDARTLGRWNPARAADITAARLELCAALHAGMRSSGPAEEAVERLVLVFEELVSNGVRHGRPPIEVVVTGTGDSWLLAVVDAAEGTLPTPDPGRDPALGGLGLALVASVSGAHGWEPLGDGRKVVWARVDHAGVVAPSRIRPARERRSVRALGRGSAAPIRGVS